MNYRGYEIRLERFGYTIQYAGCEIAFCTEEDAMLFIDEVCEPE